MSNLTDAINNLNTASNRAVATTEFYSRVADGDKNVTVANPNSGVQVPSFKKMVNDIYTAENVVVEANASKDAAAQSAVDAAASAASIEPKIYAHTSYPWGVAPDGTDMAPPGVLFDFGSGKDRITVFNAKDVPVKMGVEPDENFTQTERTRFESVISVTPSFAGQKIVVNSYHGDDFSGELLFTVVASGTGVSDGGKFIDVGGFQLRQNLAKPFRPSAWGAKGDGVTDDLAPLQNTIRYAAPFEYLGSIPETTAASNNSRSSVYLDVGVYRITSPLLLAPYLHIFGDTMSSWDNKKADGTLGGSTIIADFDDKDSFVLDTAPWSITDGTDPTRKTGMLYPQGPIDNGEVAAAGALLIEKINIAVVAGRNIKGSLNLPNSTLSCVYNCGMSGANIGIQFSSAWGGVFKDNWINARAIGIYAFAPTVWTTSSNYITIGGPKPVNGVDFDWPSGIYDWYGDNPDDTCCYYGKFDSTHLQDNTMEHGDIGVQFIGGVPNSINTYLENIALRCYVINSAETYVKLSITECPNASLYKIGGSDTQVNTFDFAGSNAATKVKELGLGLTKRIELVNFYPSSSTAKYNENVLTPYDSKSEVDIYLDNSGDDSHWGYTKETAVRTIQGALERAKQGALNIIHVTDGQTVNSKYEFFDGTVSNRWLENTDVKILGNNANRPTIHIGSSFNEIYALPIGNGNLSIEGVNIDMNGIVIGGGASGVLVKSYGNSSHTFRKSTLTNIPTGQFSLIGVQGGNSAIMHVVMDDFSAAGINVSSAAGGAMAFVLNVDAATVLTGGQIGTAHAIYSNATF